MSLPLKISLGGAKSAISLKKNTSQNGSLAQSKTLGKNLPFQSLNDDDDIVDQSQAESGKSSSVNNKRKAGGSQHDLYGGTLAQKSAQVLSREQRLRMAEAESLDASVFSYDEVYDNMKKGEREAEEAKKVESAQRKPKYVEGLQKAAEQRKTDRTRAEDKMIARERATEGDLYKDKESFVTDAYREQQAELRKAEEEERKREEQNAGKKGGLASFYATYLNDKDKKHADAMEGAKQIESEPAPENIKEDLEPSDAQLAKETEQKLGHKVTLNEDGQIVDRRELLSGGLNVSKPKRIGPASGPPQAGGFALSIAEREAEAKKQEQEERKKKEDEDFLLHGGLTAEQRGKLSRQRLSKEIERQLAEVEKKRAEDERKQFEDSIKTTFAKRNDESKVEAMRRAAMERRKKREREIREEEAAQEADQR